MKGLALLLSPKGGSKGSPPVGASEDDDSESPESSGSIMSYARLVVDAIKDGDTESAAEALAAAIKAAKE